MRRVPDRGFRTTWAAIAPIRMCGALLLFAGLQPAAADVGVTLPSPLRVVGPAAGGAGANLAIDGRILSRIRTLPRVTLSDLPLGAGESVTVDVRRIEPFRAAAQLIVVRTTQVESIAPPEVLVLAGTVAREAGSLVLLSFAQDGDATIVNGLVQRPDGPSSRTYVFSSGPTGDSRDIVVCSADRVPAGWLPIVPIACGSDALPWLDIPPRPGPPPTTPRGNPPCRLATIAIETDQEYLADRFGGNAVAAAAYAATLTAAVSEIYERDFNVRLRIGFLRLWDAPDPWDQTDAYGQIFQFRDYWNENMQSVSRNAAQFLSARELTSANGLAYLGGLCSAGFDYSLATRINGYFPYPIENNHPQNWDLFLVAHELGHIVGAPHTHAMSPPVDRCDIGDCSVSPFATIMSLCDNCPGGLANVLMQVHPRSVSEFILPFLNFGAGCDLTSEVSITQQPVGHDGCPGQPFSLSVSATGTGMIGYQWRRDGQPIPGATAAAYHIESFDPSNAGEYDVVVTDDCGVVVSTAVEVGVCASVAGDLNGNCVVDIGDLSYFLTRYGSNDGTLADLDHDGDVDLADLAVILGSFGLNGCN